MSLCWNVKGDSPEYIWLYVFTLVNQFLGVIDGTEIKLEKLDEFSLRSEMNIYITWNNIRQGRLGLNTSYVC